MNDTKVHFFQNEARSFASILTATARPNKAFTLKTTHVAKVSSPTTEFQLASKIYGSVADNCQSTLMPALSYTRNPAHTSRLGGQYYSSLTRNGGGGTSLMVFGAET